MLKEKIDISGLDKRLLDVEFEIACDVTNPLVGENGASRIFGPQKGATEEMVKILDSGLANYDKVIKKDLGIDVANVEGAVDIDTALKEGAYNLEKTVENVVRTIII